MAWWTKINGDVKKYDGRKPKLGAAIAIRFANLNGVPVEEMGLYKKDPTKHPDAENLLPATIARAGKGGRR